MNQHPVGPAMIHSSEAAAKGPSWNDLFEPGVKHALVVGVGLQILQQVLCSYTPQILEEAGIGIHLSNLGIGSISTSFLISAIYNFVDASMHSCCHEAHGYLREKVTAAHRNSNFDLGTRYSSPWGSSKSGCHCECRYLDHQCCGVLLLLRHGIRPDSQYTLCRDLPNMCSSNLYCQLCPNILDL